jgi:leucyl/phenylalanyl-tRNA--protein transferase
MPVFQLTDQIAFPPPELAEPNGLLAVGGDLFPARLVEGYRQGIFPWYSEGNPILWWFTSPRLVLFLEEFKISSRLRRYHRNSEMNCTINEAFEAVISACAETRKEKGEDTWITDEMASAYIEMHRQGYAHSVECWNGTRLAGGLYGIALGKVFFGESMFSEAPNSSKFSLIHLVSFLSKNRYRLIDCQMTTPHLVSMGAEEIDGSEFRQLLEQHIQSTAPDSGWYDGTDNQ